jgi:hypothetical protein
LDAAHRWRTLLGLGLAGLVTLGVVVAYRPSESTDSASMETSTDPDDESAIDSVTDFPSTSTTAPVVSPGAGDGDNQVESAIDGRSSTTANSTTSQRQSTSADDPTTTDAASPTSAAPAPSTTSPPGSTATTGATGSTSSSSSVPAEATVRQTEDGDLIAPAAVRNQHDGFSGSGYVGELITSGAGVTVKVESTGDGTIGYTIRYATPPQGPEGDRTLTLSVNGTAVETVVFPPTSDVTSWATVSGTVTLAEGPVDLTLAVGEDDTGWVNIDYVSLP